MSEPNTDTTQSAEKIEVRPGEDHVSFEDLEQFTQEGIRKEHLINPEEEVKEEVKEEQEVTKEAETVEEIQDPLKKAELEKLKESVGKADKDAKIINVKQGEDELALRVDTEFEVVVNGKTERAPLQDLINNYAGRTHVAREVTRLNQEKAALESDRSTLQGTVNDLYDKAITQKDPMGAIAQLADLMGADPVEVVQSLRSQVEEKAKQYSELTEEQIEIANMKEALKLQKDQQTSMKARQESADVNAAIHGRTMTVLKENNIDEVTFKETYDRLNDAVNRGELESSELTPELVGEYWKQTTQRESIGSLLDEVNSDLKNRDDAIEMLSEVMDRQPSFSIEDIKDIAVETYGNKRAKDLSRKLKKTKPANTVRAVVEPDDEPWNFDQL